MGDMGDTKVRFGWIEWLFLELDPISSHLMSSPFVSMLRGGGEYARRDG